MRNARSLSEFQILSGLGTGGTAAVLLARHVSCRGVFALKIMRKAKLATEIQVQRVATELRILRACEESVFTTRCHCAMQNESKLVFVLDFNSGGDLFFHLFTRSPERRFSEEAVRFYAAELILALDFLHERGTVFRDLKVRPGIFLFKWECGSFIRTSAL